MLTKFHVLDSAGSIVGSINVQNSEAADLERHWLATPSRSPCEKRRVGRGAGSQQAPGGASPGSRQTKGEPRSGRDAGSRQEKSAKPSRNSARLLRTVKDFGIEGMVNTSLWCERVAGTETLSLGHSAFSRNECEMELSGRSFSYWVTVRGGWIWISVRELDNASNDPDVFFNLSDTPASGPTRAGLSWP